MAKTLDLSIELQQCSQWCWAATASAVCRFYKDTGTTSQQDIANLVQHCPVGFECPCQQDPFAACNAGHNLATVLDAVFHGRDGANGLAKLDFQNNVVKEIDAGRPIVAAVTLVDDAAASDHAIVIYGYTDNGLVVVADPMHPGTTITIPFAGLMAGKVEDLGGSHATWKAAYRTTRING